MGLISKKPIKRINIGLQSLVVQIAFLFLWFLIVYIDGFFSYFLLRASQEYYLYIKILYIILLIVSTTVFILELFIFLHTEENETSLWREKRKRFFQIPLFEEFLKYPKYLKYILGITFLEFLVIFILLIENIISSFLHSKNILLLFIITLSFLGPVFIFYLLLHIVNILFDAIKIKLSSHFLGNFIFVKIVDTGRYYGKFFIPLGYNPREVNHTLIQFTLKKGKFFLPRLKNLRYNIALIYHSFYSFLLFILFPEAILFIFTVAATSANFEIFFALGLFIIFVAIYKFRLVYHNIKADINLLHNIIQIYKLETENIDIKLSYKLEKAVLSLKEREQFFLGIWDSLKKLLQF